MNTLSWFLYFIDVSTHLKELLHTINILGVIILPVLLLLLFWVSEDSRLPYSEVLKKFKFWIYLKCFYVVWVLFALTLFIPSKNTLYAIAASELGEEAVKSSLGQKTFKALENWIDSQLEGGKKSQ